MSKETINKIEANANVSLDGLARSFRVVENGNAEGAFTCAAVVSRVLFPNDKTWNYREPQPQVNPVAASRNGIALAALSMLSTDELFLLGVDSPTKSMRNAAREVLKIESINSTIAKSYIGRIKDLADEASSSVSRFTKYAEDALGSGPELRKRIDDIAWANFQLLTPGQQQAAKDKATFTEIERMKRSIVFTEKTGEKTLEYDEYTLAIESILGRSPGLSKKEYDVAKQKAVNCIVLAVADAVSKDDLLEILTKPYIARVAQQSSITTVRKIIVNNRPDFVPWLSDNNELGIKFNLLANEAENQRVLKQQLLKIIEEEERNALDQKQDKKLTIPQGFSENPPNEKEFNLIVEQIINNRKLLIARAEEFGLDPIFLRDSQSQFIVGPFVSPSPISTTFAGIVDNFAISSNIGATFVKKLAEVGMNAQQYASVNLSMTEIPTRGKEAMDCVIVPKKSNDNQRVSLAGNNQPVKSYSAVEMSNEDIEVAKKRLREAFYMYTDRFPTLRLEKRGSVIIDEIINDIEVAYKSSQLKAEGSRGYLDFAVNLNKLMTIRAGLPDLDCVFVDTSLYAPFIRGGITDIEAFIGKLGEVSFFEDDPNFMKIVDNEGKSRILKFDRIENSDVILYFKDTGEEVLFSVLQKSKVDIAPCKELSYILCMANMVPVLYGDINSGYYEPYEVAKKRVEQLGFDPILYRVQPKISDRYEEIDTVFDFYRQILLT